MRRTFKSTLWIALAAVVTLQATTETAQAQRGGRGGSGWTFVAKKYDADKDGSVSASEYTRGEEAFKTLDTNEDGVLNEDDWKSRSRNRDSGEAPAVGDTAPDFSLTEIRNAETTVTLSDFADQKAVALLFGSCT